LLKVSTSLLFSIPSTNILLARNMFHVNRVTRIMHYASFNEALMKKPTWGLVNELTLDNNGIQRLHEEKELVLGPQGRQTPALSCSRTDNTLLGSLCECGKV
jgi:hypothetical protein